MKKLIYIFLLSFSFGYGCSDPQRYYEEGQNWPTTDTIGEMDTNLIYTVVEEMPEFIDGGMEGLKKYIATNLNYEKIAAKKDVQGKVYVKFIVRASGTIDKVEVLRGISGCEECSKEAIRVISGMPKWKAGKQNGKFVDVYFNVPVKFELK